VCAGHRFQRRAACLQIDTSSENEIGSILIGSRAPDFVIGNCRAPKFSTPNQRRVIIDGDVRQADALRYYGMLAECGNGEFRGLSTVLKLGLRVSCQK